MSNSFSKLEYDVQTAARKKVEGSLDKYARFTWRNEDAWTKFGAFIISDKLGDLQFYHGAEFSNEYSKPQFSDRTGDLLGVSFNTPQISLKVGFYYISEAEYRQLLEWFSPYEVSWLGFGYDTKWVYQAKVSKIGSISRYVVGRKDDIDYYYGETTITFDLVGSGHTYSAVPFEFIKGTGGKDYICFNPEQKDIPESDLDFPLEITISINLNNILSTADTTNSVSIQCSTYLCEDTFTFEGDVGTIHPVGKNYDLFSVSLSHLSADSEGTYWLNIKYLSDSGLLLCQYGNSQEKLLTLQNTVSSGQRFVQALTCNKFKWPGKFSANINYKNKNEVNKIYVKVSTPDNPTESKVIEVPSSGIDYKNTDVIVYAEGRAETNSI